MLIMTYNLKPQKYNALKYRY